MRKDGRYKNDIYAKAVDWWGYNSQMLMAVEEMAGLTDVLMKLQRGRTSREEVAEEIADVQIMMEQLAFIFGRRDVELIKAEKLKRLAGIIKKQKGGRADQ